jgi:hypothetical protein
MAQYGGKEFACFKYIEWPDGQRKCLSIYRKGKNTYLEHYPVFWVSKDIDREIEQFYDGAKVVATVTCEEIAWKLQEERGE